MDPRLIYFADPMCSWCWGFSPAIESLRARFAEELPVQLVLGGLRPGTTAPMDESAKTEIRSHWDHVHEASGQPFDFDFFERQGFVYDTEPACRAAVAARRLDEAAAMPFLAVLHRAFYAENRDVTDRGVLCELAAESGIERAGFEREFDSEDSLAETRKDFMMARQAGVTGFPTLLAGDESEGFGVVTRGYQSADKIETLLAAWLERARKSA